MVKHELHGPPRAVGEVEIWKTAFPEPFKDTAISFTSLLILGPIFVVFFITNAKSLIWRPKSASFG